MYTAGLNLDAIMLSNILKMIVFVHLSLFKSLRYSLALDTRLVNSKVYLVNRDTMLDREAYWMETLQTSYPYGLNERKNKTDLNLLSGC